MLKNRGHGGRAEISKFERNFVRTHDQSFDFSLAAILPHNLWAPQRNALQNRRVLRTASGGKSGSQALALRVDEATTDDEVLKRIVEAWPPRTGSRLRGCDSSSRATSARRAGCEKNVPTRLDASIWWPALAARRTGRVSMVHFDGYLCQRAKWTRSGLAETRGDHRYEIAARTFPCSPNTLPSSPAVG